MSDTHTDGLQSPTEGIQVLYTELALHPWKDFGWGKGKENARNLGYDAGWLNGLPDVVWESAAAVGNPFSLGSIMFDETVVDLGCGAGADLCIAASLIGDRGRAIGIDITPAMVYRAEENARLLRLRNVEIYVADITAVPLEDACADVVISNGAINLSPHKPCVFKEVFRILRPGGRFQFADMVRDCAAATPSCGSWADCVSGTVEPAAVSRHAQRGGLWGRGACRTDELSDRSNDDWSDLPRAQAEASACEMIPGGPTKKGRSKSCLIVSVGDGMIEGFFPATAMPDSDWWETLWPRPGEVLAELGLQPDMEVVDLCCGDGLFTAPLARMVHHVVAIDLDRQMLDLARAKVAATGAENCEFIEANAYDVADWVSRPIAFVLMANTFHGVPEKERLARAVATILKPGGRFAVINWHRRPREQTTVLGQPRGPGTNLRMEPEDVVAAVEPAGLTCARVVEFPPYHYGAIFQKPVAYSHGFSHGDASAASRLRRKRSPGACRRWRCRGRASSGRSGTARSSLAPWLVTVVGIISTSPLICFSSMRCSAIMAFMPPLSVASILLTASCSAMMVALCCSATRLTPTMMGLRHAPSARSRHCLQQGDRQAAEVDGGAGVSARARHLQMIEMAESGCFPT